MSFIKIKNLTHRYDPRKTDGISNLNFELNQGEVLALIGPSGSGKSTTLKCLSGEIPCEGVHYAEDIQLSLMDQNPKLEDNEIVFNLLMHKLKDIDSEAKKENQVRTVLTQLELTNEIESPISQLSAGQRQRLILVIALINNPTVLLLDEPFANLDNNLRDILLNDLWSFFKTNGTTVIWVTHNTEEAIKYSDKLALLNFGAIEQIGTPEELYFKPKNHFVATFFGANNILPGKKISDKEFKVLHLNLNLDEPLPYDDFLVAIRPEFFRLKKDGPLKGKVRQKTFCGPYQLVKLDVDAVEISMITHNDLDIKKNEQIQLELNPTAKIKILN